MPACCESERRTLIVAMGIGEEADLTAMIQLKTRCIRDGDFESPGIFDQVAQGAGWPPARRAKLGEGVSTDCEFCMQPGVAGTIRHQAWQCPATLQGIGEQRAERKHLEPIELGNSSMGGREAQKSWSEGRPPPEIESLWRRGVITLVGTGPLAELLTASELADVTGGHVDAHENIHIKATMGDKVVGGSDGSGGKLNKDARLRRAGWS